MNWGYVRVSTTEQNIDRQIDAMKGNGIDEHHILVDKFTGISFDRPNYNRLKIYIRKGDVIFIKSLDRLGRNYKLILDEWRYLTQKRKVHIVVMDMPLLDTREKDGNLLGKVIADIVLQLLAFVAESEYQNIHERQAQGIAAAKARGVKFGRPRKEAPPPVLRGCRGVF